MASGVAAIAELLQTTAAGQPPWGGGQGPADVGAGGGILCATKRLTTDDLNAIPTFVGNTVTYSPVELVPAPGPGKILLPFAYWCVAKGNVPLAGPNFYLDILWEGRGPALSAGSITPDIRTPSFVTLDFDQLWLPGSGDGSAADLDNRGLVVSFGGSGGDATGLVLLQVWYMVGELP